MKASELMIGDWVMSTHPTVPRPIKVTEIGGGNVGYKYGVIQLWFIEPIPLTPEILEMNGFEEFDGWYETEYNGNVIRWCGTIVKIGGECGNLEMPSIMYVHQLQHAFRLIGIEKEIDL